MNFFAELPAQAKALIGGLIVLFVVAVGANFLPRGGGAEPTAGAAMGEVLIYQNMDPKIAAEAAFELKERQIPFKLVRDGTAIAVPSDKADEARIKLAIKSLPREGDIGFSQLFGDKPGGFMTTDFEKKVAYDRALNGELSRIIRKVEGIDGASVIINRPEEQLFVEERKPTTASVMLKLAPNRSLSKQQVEGIQHLVASSVPGLKTTNVTVVSDAGKLLSDGMADNVGNPEDRDLARALDRQLMMTREREQAIEAKVQSLLDKVFGPGKSVVRVAAELDFTQKRTRTTLYAAPADARGNNAPSISSKTSEKTGSSSTGGVPGTSSNVPTGAPAYGMAGTTRGANGYEKTSEQVKNDAYSTNQTLTEDEVGTLKRLSVTALIQGLPAERVPAMIQIVASTAGADVAGRGDQIVVQPVAFDTSQNDMLRQLIDQEEKAKLAGAAAKKKDGGIPLSWIIGTGAAFVVLILLLAIIRMANRKEDTTDVLVNTLGDTGMPADFDPNALGGQYGYEMQGTVPQGYGQQGYGPANDGAFGFLEEQDPGMVAELIGSERPATAAGILRELNPAFADQVLAYMQPEVQEDLVQRYNTQQPLPAFQQRTLAQQLKRRLGVPV